MTRNWQSWSECSGSLKNRLCIDARQYPKIKIIRGVNDRTASHANLNSVSLNRGIHMEYNINIYETDDLNKYRFALGSLSVKTLFCFGINPSTADDKEPDQTIKKVMGFAEKKGYASFVMFNLYPQRATNPDDLPREANQQVIQRNIEIISEIVSQQEAGDILLAWGGLLYSRGYFVDCLKQIYESLKPYSLNWLRIGDLLKSGQPRHPLYAPYNSEFQKMNMLEFLENI